MSKNIEKQGKRPGYIVGGIFALLLGAVFVMLYFPQLLTALFGVAAIWDLTETFANVFGANFMEMFATWGTSGLLLLMGAVYFICFFARPSANSTMFRFAALFGVLNGATTISTLTPRQPVGILDKVPATEFSPFESNIQAGIFSDFIFRVSFAGEPDFAEIALASRRIVSESILFPASA